MNVGIITTSKKIDYLNLPNNTYLIFYIKKNKLNFQNISHIINYLILSDCKTIIMDNKIKSLIEKENYKNINIISKVSEINSHSDILKIITYYYSTKNHNTISYENCANSRKDRQPSETVKIIKDILKTNNYQVSEKGLKRSLRGSYSIRLELNNGKGANGKGTTLELAKASAYAELIERLQSNMLNKKRITTNIVDKRHDIYEILLNMASNEYKKKFFDLNKIYFNVSEATNIKTNKKELIPINAICSFCHTNGLASGNTFEEAVNQAIFEIFERYCYQKCLEENILIRNIDISSYPLTEKNKKMLVLLKKKGFEYYIKDCSLGKYPVIGFLLFNKKHNKYTFTMGSDTSFNIALSRCITEMMQGVNFKELKQKMVPNLKAEELIQKYGTSFKSYNWLRCFNNNNGYLTKNFFNNSYINISELHFKDYLTSNKEVLNYLKFLIKENIYVIDYNNLGFDTYRVYIPYMTTVDCYDIEDLNVNKNYDKLKYTYTHILEVSKKEMLYFINIFLNNNKLLKYDEMIKPSDLFHTNEISDYYKLDFTSLLIVLCILCSKTKELQQLLQYKIENFKLNPQKILTYKITVNCITNKEYYNVKDENITKYIQYIINNPREYLSSLNPKFVNNDSLVYNKKA